MDPALLLRDGHHWVGKGEWVISIERERHVKIWECFITKNSAKAPITVRTTELWMSQRWDGGKKQNSSHQMEVNPHDLVLALNHYRLWRLWHWHHWQLGSWHIMATPQSLAGTDDLQYWDLNPSEESRHCSSHWCFTTEDPITSRHWNQH